MDPLWDWPEFTEDWYCDEMYDVKEVDKLVKEISEAFPTIPGDVDDYSFSVEATGESCWIEEFLRVPTNLGEDQDQDEGSDFPIGQKYGIGKVLKAPIKLKKDEDEKDDEGGDFPMEFTCKKYGVGKVLKAPIKLKELDDEDEDEKEDEGGDDFLMELSSKKYGVGKVLKVPIRRHREGRDEEGDFPMCRKYGVGKVLKEPIKHAQDHTCKKYGVGKVLKVPLIKLEDDKEVDFPKKKKRRLVDLSKEEHESKMRATQAKLLQSYQQTLPTRHSKVMDMKDVRDRERSKKSAGPNMDKKKPSTVQQRIMRKIQALKSKATFVTPKRKLQALWN